MASSKARQLVADGFLMKAFCASLRVARVCMRGFPVVGRRDIPRSMNVV